mgnify:FL=1
MESYPLVSVVVPCYNHETYIEACLESVANSDYNNIELVFIDDGSSDNSYNKAYEWLRLNGHLFSSYHIEKQQNQGICKTLNKLVANASGEYIIPLASDDMVTPTGVRLRVEALIQNPQWLAVFADAMSIDEQGSIVERNIETSHYGCNKQMLAHIKYIASELILCWGTPGPVFCARSQAYVEIGLYNEEIFFEDRDYYLRIASVGKLGYIPDEVAFYRIHTSNTCRTSDNTIKMIQNYTYALESNLKFFTGLNKKFLQLEYFLSKYQLKCSVTNSFLDKCIFLAMKASFKCCKHLNRLRFYAGA